MFRKVIYLAPPLESSQRRGLLFRALTALGLSTMLVLLTAATIVLSYAHYFIHDPQVTPLQLYHNTWRVAKDNIYDQSKLKDWSAWEHKFDHLIKTEDDALRYANELVEHLNETYTGLLTASVVERDKQRANGHYIGIGVELEKNGSRLTLKRVIEGGPAELAGLKAGDIIVSANGEDAAGWSVGKMSDVLKGNEGDAIVLTMRRADREFTVSVTRGKVPTPLVKTLEAEVAPVVKPVFKPVSNEAASRNASRIGYLRIESFDQWSTHEQVRAALEKLSGSEALVIDLRDNPGGFIHEAVRTAALFLEEGVVTNVIVRVPEAEYMTTQVRLTRSQILLKNSYGPVSNVPVPLLHRPPYLLKGRPVVLLVNGNTASAAEMFSAALIDNGVAIAVGTTSFGKGIGQTYVPVGNGHRLRITHIKTLTPAGTFIGDAGQTVSNGVKPQIHLEKRGWGSYGSAGDNQFQEAIRYLEQQLDGKP